MAAGAVRELVYVVEGGIAGFTSIAGVISLVVAAVSVAVGAFLAYKHSQDQASKAVAATWKEHATLVEKMNEAAAAGVRVTGVLMAYISAERSLESLTRVQLIDTLTKAVAKEDEYQKSIHRVTDTQKVRSQVQFGMMAIAAELVHATIEGTSEYDRMNESEKRLADTREADRLKMLANIASLEQFGVTADIQLERVTRATAALTKSQQDLYDSQLALLALDPEKRSLSAELKIMAQVERRYEDLTRAGVDSATARAQAEAWGANQMRLQWFQSMSEVEGVLTTGFKEAFMQIGHGIEGMEKAWASFRDAVINMIAEMAARALAFQVISGVGSGLGLFGSIAGALGLGPAADPVTAAFSTVAQHGATVPGPWGQPQLVLAHGGEHISAASGRGSAPGSRGMTVVEEHVHFHQGVLDSSAVRQVVRNTKRAQGSLGEKRF